MSDNLKTEKTTVRRMPSRGAYNIETINSILDSGRTCHIGLVSDEGQPFVFPTTYARMDNEVIIHGSNNSFLLSSLEKGKEICFSVTHVDALVLAKSAYHHSLNYRSVMIFGIPRLIASDTEKLKCLEIFVNHIIPGRWEECRKPSQKELDVTKIIAIPVKEASAKIRTGPPIDDAADLNLPFWAGVIPINTGLKYPEDAKNLPESIKSFLKKSNQ